MNQPVSASSEQLVRRLHANLWFVMLAVLYCGTVAVVMLAVPGTAAGAMAQRGMQLFPVLNVLAVAWLAWSGRGLGQRLRQQRLAELLNDELRQAALHKAYRAAFCAVLLVQPVLGALLFGVALPHAAQLLAVVTLTSGLCVFLGTLLYFDR